MTLKHIRLYNRLVVQSSFLAKWLGERVRARGWTFFFAVFYKMWFLNVGSYTTCKRLVSLGVLLQTVCHTPWQPAWLSSLWCWLLLLIATPPQNDTINYHTLSSRKCTSQRGSLEAAQSFWKTVFFYSKSSKNPYQYYKLSKNLYQVLQVTCAASECAVISKVCRIKSLPPLICCHGIVTRAAHS